MVTAYSAMTLAVVWLTPLVAFSTDVEDKEEIRQTLHFSHPAATKRVEVDNINGSIIVKGYSGQDVELVANKYLRGRSQEKLERGRQDVRLEISEEDNVIKLFVDAPYRQRDGSINYQGHRYYGYEVRFEFELRVPLETDLYLRTVNDGDIKVENVSGDHDVKNVNGGIEMHEVAGAIRCYALNDDVHVLFDKNPEAECYFGSLNGEVKISFRSNLSADARFKTFNGEVYSDFPVTQLPGATPVREQHQGRYIYKFDRGMGVRIGKGGPELEFDAFNGNILIVKRED